MGLFFRVWALTTRFCRMRRILGANDPTLAHFHLQFGAILRIAHRKTRFRASGVGGFAVVRLRAGMRPS